MDLDIEKRDQRGATCQRFECWRQRPTVAIGPWSYTRTAGCCRPGGGQAADGV